MVKNAKKVFERKLVKKSSDKLFNSYVKNKTSVKSGIGPLKDSRGSTCKEDNEMADILNGFFASIFTPKTTNARIPDIDNINCEELINVDFNPDIILTKITNLKIASAQGNDSITVNYLKVLKDTVCVPLSKIFTKSFQESKVPLSWREANVTPIFKKGDKSDPANYRPISLTSICGKLMESVF